MKVAAAAAVAVVTLALCFQESFGVSDEIKAAAVKVGKRLAEKYGKGRTGKDLQMDPSLRPTIWDVRALDDGGWFGKDDYVKVTMRPTLSISRDSRFEGEFTVKLQSSPSAGFEVNDVTFKIPYKVIASTWINAETIDESAQAVALKIKQVVNEELMQLRKSGEVPQKRTTVTSAAASAKLDVSMH